MASLRFTALLFSIFSSIILLLISPTHSLTCTSQTFSNKNLYSDCTDLPSLSAYLHWSHDPSNSSLSVAFIAPPAKPDGWIAWAINPTGTGMLGGQALIAHKQSNGSMTVDTYNLSSYSSIVKSKLSFAVYAAKAEFSGGVMRIFATLALPANMTAVNQVWQVGSSVTAGMPDRHEFQAANLNAKGVLDLVSGGPSEAPTGSGSSPVPVPAPVSGLAPSPTTTGGEKSGVDKGVSGIGKSSFVFYVFLFLASFVF